LFERVGLYDCVQLQVGCLTPFFQRRKLSQDEDARAGRILRACVLACFFREKMHFTAELEPAWELDIAKCNDLIRVRALKNSHRWNTAAVVNNLGRKRGEPLKMLRSTTIARLPHEPSRSGDKRSRIAAEPTCWCYVCLSRKRPRVREFCALAASGRRSFGPRPPRTV